MMRRSFELEEIFKHDKGGSVSGGTVTIGLFSLVSIFGN
jgi:hypothetical protein